MANRIPPSLNWLIDKRARVAGEIAKCKRSLKDAKTLLKDIEDLQIKLEAIDTTLDLHDIKVDISLITPIESKDLRISIPYGQMRKSILTCIRLYQENGPVSRDLIERFLINRHVDFQGDKVDRLKFKRIVHNALKNLYHSGYLVRHHSPQTSSVGLWTLSEKYIIK